MKYNRINELESYLKEVKSATIEELEQKFQVSTQTLRRDIKELETKGTVSKVYGGVVFNEQYSLNESKIIDIQRRTLDNLSNKQYIGKLASQLIEENDVIFVDSGTTACQLIPFLNPNLNITVITHSILVMNLLQDMHGIQTILLGGKYHPEIKSFQIHYDDLHYNFSKSFVATVGLSLQQGLTNIDVMEGEIKSKVMEHSKEVYILCDSTKFDRIAFNQFSKLTDITGVITDICPDSKYLQYFKKQNIKVFY